MSYVRSLYLFWYVWQEETYSYTMSFRLVWHKTWFLVTDTLLNASVLQDHATASSKYQEISNLEFIEFWLQSIYTYVVQTWDQEEDIATPYKSPPILIVGTHKKKHDYRLLQTTNHVRIVNTFKVLPVWKTLTTPITELSPS